METTPARRILVVTNMWPTGSAPMGGIFVAEQVNSLRAIGLEVDVLFINGLEEGWRAYPRGFGRVSARLRHERYDVIHAHYVFSGILALGGRALAGRHVPIVLTQHGIETQVGWTAPLCRWTSKFVDVTIATSRRVQQALRRPDAPVIPCGVDTDLFKPANQGEARTSLQLPPDGRLVLFAGMRRPEKRLDLIESAVAQVQASALQSGDPKVSLVIAEHVPHERMPVYMNAADVLVLASEAEGSPMVVKEALACNLPVVSVDVGDVAELIDGLPGCYVVERCAEGLGQGLTTSLSRRSRTDGRSVVEKISLSAIARQLNLLYDTLGQQSR